MQHDDHASMRMRGSSQHDTRSATSEPSTAVIAGSLVIAIYAATGKRIYSLPVKLA